MDNEQLLIQYLDMCNNKIDIKIASNESSNEITKSRK